MDAIERADVAWCWPVRYELMVDARGSAGIAALDRTLASGLAPSGERARLPRPRNVVDSVITGRPAA